MKKTDSPFLRTYFSLFLLVSLQNIIVFGLNLADNIMLGAYSELAMSGVSFANQIQFLLLMLVNGAGNGFVIIASQYWGKKQTEQMKKVFSAAFFTVVIISLVLSLLMFFVPHRVLGLLTDESEIIEAGAEYARIMAFSYTVFSVSNIFIALMRSAEDVKIGFYSSVTALIINVILNYLLIYGKWGFPEMGVRGAAAASLISRIAELIFVLLYVFRLKNILNIRASDIFRPEKEYIKDYLRSGFPLVMSGGSWGIAMMIQSAVTGHLGEAAIGASAIASPIYQVVGVFYGASANASAVIIGKTVGEGDIPAVKSYARRLQLIYIGTGLFSCLSMFALKGPVLSLYNVSPETESLAEIFITIMAFTVIGSSYECPCHCGIIAGGGDTKFTFYNDLVFMWLIVLPMSFLSAFVFHWSIPVTFLILKADQILKCFVAVIKVNRFRWIRILTR